LPDDEEPQLRLLGQSAVTFFTKSMLRTETLREIWQICDPHGDAYLDREGFYVAMRLVAMAQCGLCVSANLLQRMRSKYLPPPKLGFSDNRGWLAVGGGDGDGGKGSRGTPCLHCGTLNHVARKKCKTCGAATMAGAKEKPAVMNKEVMDGHLQVRGVHSFCFWCKFSCPNLLSNISRSDPRPLLLAPHTALHSALDSTRKPTTRQVSSHCEHRDMRDETRTRKCNDGTT